MKNLIIPASKYTPEINFDHEKCLLKLSGQSYPENTAEFYKPILDWVKAHIENLNEKKTVFDIDISYFNSSSSKVFMDIFDLLDEKAKELDAITINWYYDEEDEIILEQGEEFKEDLKNIKFNLITKNEV